MKSSPAFQFYASDFLTSTTFLSCAATGAYIRMLSVSWEIGPIPDTPTALSKAMGLNATDPPVDEIWRELQPKWTRTKAGWTNRKLEGIREQQNTYRQNKTKAGLASGVSRRAHPTTRPNSRTPPKLSVEQVLNGCSTGVEQTPQQKGNSLISDLDLRSSISDLRSLPPSPEDHNPVLRTASVTTPGAPTRDLLTQFDRRHEEKIGQRARLVPGKDAKLLADLWRTHGALVSTLMDLFFEQDTTFVRGAGYSVAVFASQFSKLLTLHATRTGRLEPVAEEDPPSRTGASLNAAKVSLHRRLARLAQEADHGVARKG